ncbi:hypothetical protein KC19_8G185600 [Ceratodon purpureus]|uniref:BRCT domain-containing protein n=1 Tax=Ceratodon purpureus TaxID=3225 RepID=A0A8T0H4W9_CERPU|nr:hypothetical protein KC19_8G185600 [Ceratodon purpureus]
MAGKADEDDDEEELAPVRWRVTDGSSEADVHAATNVLKPERYRVWQTGQPCEEAWLVVEPTPPTSFRAVEIVNAGSSLVEIHGLRDGAGGGGDYELLLSPQQVMTVKDLVSKVNRNRALVYDIDVNHKLSPVAAQQRWRKLRLICRQPFGTVEHRACIGLSYINFTTCKPRSSEVSKSKKDIDSAGKSSSAVAKRKLPSGVMPCDTDRHEEKHQKKPKQNVQQNATRPEYQKPNVKPEPQDYALRVESSRISGMDGSVSKLEGRNRSPDRKGTDGKRTSSNQKVMKEDGEDGLRVIKEPNIKKVVKPKLVIGLETATTDMHNHAPQLDCSPLHRKDSNASKTKSRNRSPDRKETAGIRKPKVEKDVEEQVVVGSKVTKCIDDAQPSPCPQDRSREAPKASTKNSKIGKPENVDIGFNAAQEVGKSEYAKRRVVAAQAPPHTKLRSADELGKEGPIGSSSKKTTAADDFAKILEGVVFAISGIENPARGLFRTQGLEMGAQYRPDWTSDCTVLVCAFMNTPKFKQVKEDGGSIVSKEWISECHKQRKLVSIERFLMNKGRPWRLPVHKANCGSLEEVREWVYDDLASTSNWLQQQNPKPEAEELDFTAAQGIMVCFEDTIKCIQNNQGVKSIVDSWECLPRAIKELAALEEGRGGYMKGTRSIMLGEADRMKHVYSDILKPIFDACSKNPPSAIKKEKRRSH